MLTTHFTELIGCSVPIQQAGMGSGIANPRLAAAVANAGGLGMVSVYGDAVTPDVVAKVLDRTRQQTSGAIGANFLLAGVDPARARAWAAAAKRARVVDFFWGEPDLRWSRSSMRVARSLAGRSAHEQKPSLPLRQDAI
jgi:nitronate monooxygenase